MTALLVLVLAGLALLVGGRLYSRFIARSVGEDPGRLTPALSLADGRDYVATPTGVVFAHHFASIAGAGPIVGPVLAIVYGYLPALIWVVLGGLLVGAVHDYLATYMATREGGQSIATVARRVLGKGPFVALTLMLILMLALVCATFLNLSANALSTMLPAGRLQLDAGQSLFRTDPSSGKVIIGGIASTSVIVITAVAPLLGWLYIRKQIRALYCSMLAIGICAVSIVAGLYLPVAMPQQVSLGPWQLEGTQVWMLLLSAYCVVAAGVPVWIFLQSRDFINVHILYAGMIGLVVTLLVLGAGGAGAPGAAAEATEALPAFNPSAAARIIEAQENAPAPIWPMLFITIACGAVSGFHSLCAGGTTCKQLTSERAARTIGYGAMLLETFLAVCVIGVMIVGVRYGNYLADVYPKAVGAAGKANAVLAFAAAVGNAVHKAWGLPVAAGTLAGMILLEGFLVTTLDTAVRLTRYLIEEVWRAAFGRYDVFAEPVAAGEPQQWRSGENVPAGAEGLPAAPALSDQQPAPARALRTTGLFRGLLKALRLYWVNSGLAIALTLAFAFSGGANALWKIFASSNQLLAGLGLGLASLWLMRQAKRAWFAAIPAVIMLLTTIVSFLLLLIAYLRDPLSNITLLVADVVILAIAAYLLAAGLLELRVLRRRNALAARAAPQPVMQNVLED